jgi:hypothetical protein
MQVEGENDQNFKDLNITMDKYVLHSNFHAIDRDDVDIILDTVNINLQKKFMKLWYKKEKITFQDISLIKQQGPEAEHEEVIVGTVIPHF